MKVEIITIGNELTSGEVVNTNASYMAEMLTDAGLEVAFITTTGDDPWHIEDVVLRAQERAEAIILCGGLGPSKEDITVGSAAKALGLHLVLNREILEGMRQRFTQRGGQMPLSNEKQAFFPQGAEIFPNPLGTAGGFVLRRREKIFLFLPDVPEELKHLFEGNVLPFLKREQKQKVVVRSTTLKVFGVAESAIADMLKDIDPREFSASLTYFSRFPENHVKITVKGGLPEEAEGNLQRIVERVLERLRGQVVATGQETLEEIAGRLLRTNRATLAVAESCTGGLVAHRITQVPGSSDYFERGVVVYSNAAKVQILGVPEPLLLARGAVSAEVAEKMAEGVRRVGNTTLGLGITGIAGPEGGSEAKPVGTVFIALASPDGTVSERYQFQGDRKQIKTLSAYTAIDRVRRYFLNQQNSGRSRQGGIGDQQEQ